jgi:hypothetical protein
MNGEISGAFMISANPRGTDAGIRRREAILGITNYQESKPVKAPPRLPIGNRAINDANDTSALINEMKNLLLNMMPSLDSPENYRMNIYISM